jgi:predicted phosphatase
MSDTEKRVDPIPESFESYADAADFWDHHDTTDYLDEFETVDVTAKFHRRVFEIALDEDVAKALQRRAQQIGTTPSRLASDMLRRQIDVGAK